MDKNDGVPIRDRRYNYGKVFDTEDARRLLQLLVKSVEYKDQPIQVQGDDRAIASYFPPMQPDVKLHNTRVRIENYATLDDLHKFDDSKDVLAVIRINETQALLIIAQPDYTYGVGNWAVGTMMTLPTNWNNIQIDPSQFTTLTTNNTTPNTSPDVIPPRRRRRF